VETLSKGNVERLEAYRNDTERLMANGLATRNDLLRIDVQLSQARIEELEARNTAQLARMRLNTMIGRPTRNEYTLSTAPTEESLATGAQTTDRNIEELVQYAIHHRPDLVAAETRSQAAAQMVNAAGGAWWPQVELNANYQYNNPNSRYQPITPEFLGTWDVGVTMLFEIWNWGETGSKVEQAQAGLRRADIRRMQLIDEITLEVNEAVLTLGQSREKKSFADLAVTQAAENLRVTNEKYREGSATSTELLDAEIDLHKAEVRLSSAEIEHALALASLRRSLGVGLSEERPK
jgi:outer membrane protein TolC